MKKKGGLERWESKKKIVSPKKHYENQKQFHYFTLIRKTGKKNLKRGSNKENRWREDEGCFSPRCVRFERENPENHRENSPQIE